MSVSLSDPRSPKESLQILLTTLRTKSLKPIPSCSKASGVFSSRCRYPASSLESNFHRACRWDSSPIITPFVRFGTYPKRNCATLERFNIVILSSVLLTLYNSACRHAVRTISSSIFIDVWRIVSEDSFSVDRYIACVIFSLSPLSFVQFFSDENDFSQSIGIKMLSLIYENHDLLE